MSRLVHFELDASVYDGALSDPTTIYSDLEKAVRLDLRHHYLGPIGARYWLSLCNSRQYGHKTLVEVTQKEIPHALSALRAAMPTQEVDLVSLGPGDGDIDRRILQRLQEDFQSVGYVCIDISFELLQHATARILHERALKRVKRPIWAICGDFTKIDALPNMTGKTARLFCLTGFTLGNHNESALMDAIDRALSPGDFLFLDARLHNLPHVNGHLTDHQTRSLIDRYASDLSNRFAFGPVELVTTSAARDATFAYDVNRSITVVCNAVNVITYCKDLHTRMRFTGRPVHATRLDLASATLYNYSDLVHWLSGRNFQLLWHTQTSGIGLFLLHKPPISAKYRVP